MRRRDVLKLAGGAAIVILAEDGQLQRQHLKAQLLRAPLKASPRSLAGQVEYIRKHWGELLPLELMVDLLTALDIAHEEF